MVTDLAGRVARGSGSSRAKREQSADLEAEDSERVVLGMKTDIVGVDVVKYGSRGCRWVPGRGEAQPRRSEGGRKNDVLELDPALVWRELRFVFCDKRVTQP